MPKTSYYTNKPRRRVRVDDDPYPGQGNLSDSTPLGDDMPASPLPKPVAPAIPRPMDSAPQLGTLSSTDDGPPGEPTDAGTMSTVDDEEALRESQAQQAGRQAQEGMGGPDAEAMPGMAAPGGAGSPFLNRMGMARTEEAFAGIDPYPYERLQVFGLKGAPQRAPFQSALRQQEADARDTMSDADRAMVSESLGIQVPPGARWSNIERVAPAMASAFRARNGGGLALERLALSTRNTDLRERGLDMEEQRLGESRQNRGLREKALELSETRSKRPPASQQAENAALLRAEKYLDTIEGDFKGVKDRVGPVFGRLQIAARTFGLNDPRVARLQADLTDAMGDYLTLKTGAQRGMTEVQFLLQALPKITDSSQTFEELMRGWRSRISVEKDTRRKLAGVYGYEDPFQDQPVTTTTPAQDRAQGQAATQGDLQEGEAVYVDAQGNRFAGPANLDLSRPEYRGIRRE